MRGNCVIRPRAAATCTRLWGAIATVAAAFAQTKALNREVFAPPGTVCR
jgi:hypothetical protein